MIDILIERSNSTKFYQDCDFNLERKEVITRKNKLALTFSINQNDYNIPIKYEEWKITCNGYTKSQYLDHKILLPFVQMSILDRHPSLWQFNEKKYECYFTGIPDNLREFIGNISIELENATGNWVQLTDLFWNFENYFKNERKKYIVIPEPLLDIIKKACEDYNMGFEIISLIPMQNKAQDLNNLRLLIFGNKIVSPHSFYLQQPYVIAESFEAIRIK